MSNPTQIFAILLLSGLFMIGLEIFVPGGILGLLGGLALVAASVMAFTAFGAQVGFMATLMIIMLVGVCIVVWVKYFPKTPMGRALTLSRSGRSFKSSSLDEAKLLDKEGTAETDLHPAGIVRINGQRIDVVAESGWIEDGTPVRVIKVEGNHVMVRKIKQADPASTEQTEV